MKKFLYSTILTLLFIGYIVVIWPEQNDQLSITMLDVGQGDAFYIRTPHGQDILIDGGPDRQVLWELGSTMPPHDHTLEYVIATHPDADHIAGLAEIPDMFVVERLVTNGVRKDTGVSDALERLREEVIPITAHRGQRLDIEADLWIEFLHPNPEALHGDAYNNDSLVFILHYKDFSALFTGDIEQEVEEELVALYGTQLDVDMLKVGHHGSKTSTTQSFLDAVTPTTALISVGVENRFGHPNPGVLWRLEQMGVPVWRSDIHGRVQCESDGRSVVCVAK